MKLTEKTIKICPDYLRHIGVLICEVLSNKKIVDKLDTTAFDLQKSLESILNKLKNNNIESHNLLIQNIKNLENCNPEIEITERKVKQW